MGHLEISIEVDHRTADGNEEPHILRVEIDGLDASTAWGRATEAVYGFLKAEIEAQELVAEGATHGCSNNKNIEGVSYLCNLPPDHPGPHQNFQSGRSWPRRGIDEYLQEHCA